MPGKCVSPRKFSALAKRVLHVANCLSQPSIKRTGCGNSIAKGMRKAIAERGALGIFTGGFTAGAAGICAAIVFGYLAALLFRPKDK